MRAFFQAMVAAMPSGKTPVFIVDSIDHCRGRAATFDEVRDSVESLFSRYASEPALPSMHVVYTAPVYAEPAGWEGRIWPVLSVKVQERDGGDCRRGSTSCARCPPVAPRAVIPRGSSGVGSTG